MKKSSKKSEAEILRQKAEEVIKSMLPVKNALRSWMTEADALKLIHELEVHQIELGLQNEELMLSKEHAETASKKYVELYDFSPAGYFTLSKEGKIIEMNLSGSQMLGKERAHLINSSFGFFVSNDTKQTFNNFLGKVFTGKAKETCEVTLSLNDDLPIYVQLTGIVSDNGEQCLMTIVDITGQKQALKSAGISVRQKNLILEATGEGILGIDLAANNTFANPMAVEILGYSIDELHGKNSHTIFHHHHRDGAYYPAEDCPILNTLMTGKPAVGEEYFWRKDGTGFPVEFSSLPIIEDFQITGAVITFRDISAYKQAEEDARKAYEILEATLDALPDVLFDVGLDGYCYDVHSPRTELLNRPARDIIGKTIPNIFPSEISGIFMAAIKEAHENGFSLGRQYEMTDPLGTFWFELFVSRKVGAPDSPNRFIILRRDITERNQAYEVLRRSEAKLAKMVSNIGDVIVIIDQDGINKYTSPNIEKYFGWKPEEVVGASTWENVHPEDLASAQKFIGTLMGEPNATGSAEFRQRRKDGSYRWIEIRVINLLNDPDIQGLVGNYHEITPPRGV